MLRWLRRRKRSRQHPTPEQALFALEEGRCMYSALTNCSSRMKSVGLRADDDANSILVCKAHYGRLRKLDARQAGKLERVLHERFLLR